MTQDHNDYPIVVLPGGHTTIDVAKGKARNIARDTRKGEAYDYRLEHIDFEFLKQLASDEARRFARGRDWDQDATRAFVEDTVRRLEEQLRRVGTLDALKNPSEVDRPADEDEEEVLVMREEMHALLESGKTRGLPDLLREYGIE